MAELELLNSAAAETSERHIRLALTIYVRNNLSGKSGVPQKKLSQRSVSVVLRSLRQSCWFFPLLATMIACATQPVNPEEGKPAWMQSLIASIEAEPVWNPPATITRYNYRGAAVYYLAAHCCDIRSKLYSASGSLVCEPDGGITGKGDGKCDDFLATRRDEKLVWKDQRGK